MSTLSGAALLASAVSFAAGADTHAITVDNAANLPATQVATVLADFRDWQARLHAYFGVPARPVTVRITRDVAFGFYRDGVVLLPPNDRQAMLEDWVHELTHHLLGRESSFFLREGAATHAVDALFARAGLTPRGWPYFGRTCDEWVSLFAHRDALPPLATMLAWPRYRGDSPEHDFRSWQIYLAGCSFVGWTIAQDGLAGFRAAFAARGAGPDPARVERAWRHAVAARRLAPFDAAAVLPGSPRYRDYAERLN